MILIGVIMLVMALVILTLVSLALSRIHRGERLWQQTVASYQQQGVSLDPNRALIDYCPDDHIGNLDWINAWKSWKRQAGMFSGESIQDWFAARPRHLGTWTPIPAKAASWLDHMRPIVAEVRRLLQAHPGAMTALAMYRGERHGRPADCDSWFGRPIFTHELISALMLQALTEDDPSDSLRTVDQLLATTAVLPDDYFGVVADAKYRMDALTGLLALAMLGRLSPEQGDVWCSRWCRPLQKPLADANRITMRFELPLVVQSFSDRDTLRLSWSKAFKNLNREDILQTWTLMTATHEQAVQVIPYLQTLEAWCEAGDARIPPPLHPASLDSTMTMVGVLVGKLDENCQQMLLIGAKQDLLAATVRLVTRLRAGAAIPSDQSSLRRLVPDLRVDHAATGLSLSFDTAAPANIRLRWVETPGVTPKWAKADLSDQSSCVPSDPERPYRITRSCISLDLAAEPRFRLRDPLLEPGRGVSKPSPR